MKVEDGVLENVKEIRGEGYAEGPKWCCRMAHKFVIATDRRPNAWVRFWQFVLFGWRWEWR